MTTDIRPCKGCHRNWLPAHFDIKKDGSLKLTCRKCLLTQKSRFQSKPKLAVYRDIKKIRLDIMTAIHMIDDAAALSLLLTNCNHALIQMQAQTQKNIQSSAFPSSPQACIANDTEHTMDEVHIVPHDIAASLPQTLCPPV